MASPDTVIGYHKLDTKFFDGHVEHTTFHSDASRGSRLEVVKTWYRGRELGRGSFGSVFLERSEGGEHRAVKVIAKEQSRIDYRRELVAMAMLAKFLGWYESSNHIHIAMEYISYGNLRSYLGVERPENEAKVITRQLLEGLAVIHQEGFAHRDLKPENIFVVSTSPMSVKIGDFGLAKLARGDTAFRTQAFSRGYSAPDMVIATSDDSSEYTNAVDIWALGCITHEMLTRALPFSSFFELRLYCVRPEFPRDALLSKNISEKGIEIVEHMLALPPDRRIAAKEALDSEWLRLEGEGVAEQETERSTRLVLPEERAFPMLVQRNSTSAASFTYSSMRNSVGDAMVPTEAFDRLGPANSHVHHSDSSASIEGGLPETTELPSDFSPGYDQQSSMPYIPVDENGKHLLSHFLDNVLPTIFPILDLHVDARQDVVLPVLADNECYRACCLSSAALHLMATHGLQEWTEQDIRRHWYGPIAGIYGALERDQDHLQILQTILGIIFFECSVGSPDDSLINTSWREHFRAVINLVNKLDLTHFLRQISPYNLSIPSVNMTLTAWVDILSAATLNRKPQFADVYRMQHLNNSMSGLRELMGCDDRVMYLISEVCCLEALGNSSILSDYDLRERIKSLAHQIDLTESATDQFASTAAPIITASGQIDTRQLTNAITDAFRFAARIYLCSLDPGFDRHQPHVMGLLNKLTLCLESIPAGPDGFDRSLVWVYHAGGSVATSGSLFISFFKGRCAALGDAVRRGSFGRMARVLEILWARWEAGLEGSWYGVTLRNSRDFLLI